MEAFTMERLQKKALGFKLAVSLHVDEVRQKMINGDIKYMYIATIHIMLRTDPAHL